MADEETKSTASDGEVAGGKRRLPLLLGSLIVLAGAGFGAWYFLLGSEAAPVDAETVHEEPHGDPLYFTLAENLVVNFRSPGGTRFLQVSVDVMTYDDEGLYALEKYAPVLRSELILLLSDQVQDELMSRAGKEALRETALAEIRTKLTALHGSPIVESLYFTSFVMQ